MTRLGLELRQRGAFSPRSLFADGAAGAWYDPADLASLSLNSDGTGAAVTGSPVGRMQDKSGRGNHAVQAVAALCPILRQDSGGRHYLEFDGTDDWIEAAFAPAIAHPIDRICAIRQLSWTDGDRIIGSSAIEGVPALYQRTAADQVRLFSGALGPITSGLATGVNCVITERHHGANSRIALNNGAYVPGDAGTGSAPSIRLAAAQDSNLRPGHFRLYGLCMIGRALNDAETMRLRRFMAARAGILL